MKEIYLLYTTDAWHSYDSRNLIGISESRQGLLILANKYANKIDGNSISDEQTWNFINIGQTQGYEGNNIGEFVAEIITLNTLI